MGAWLEYTGLAGPSEGGLRRDSTGGSGYAVSGVGCNPSTRQVDVLTLPRSVDLLQVDGTQVYGRVEGSDVVPALVRYRIEERANDG